MRRRNGKERILKVREIQARSGHGGYGIIGRKGEGAGIRKGG